MADAQKKVIVRMFGGGLVWAYLPSAGFVQAGRVELLAVEGKVIQLDLKDIKTISYVRDFNLEDAEEPERIGRRAFLGRPRGDGLWLKVGFLDADSLEGMSHFDGGFLDGLIEDHGFRMTPPEARSNTQSVFVPRTAVAELEVLGYVSTPAKRKAKAVAGMAEQPRLFEE